MSLGIVIKGPEGIVLAAESRVTLTTQVPGGGEVYSNFDNATKLLSFRAPNACIGAVTYGQAAIGIRTVHSLLPEFESNLPGDRLPVEQFATRLSQFFEGQWNTTMPALPQYQGPDITLVVAGFDDGQPYGKVFSFDIPRRPTPLENYANDFGITWGGQREFVDRLIQGFDNRLLSMLQAALSLDQATIENALNTVRPQLQMPLPLQFMALQDHIDLALFFIRTTIAAQALTVGIRGCGGPIDIASITRGETLQFIKKKQAKV